MKQLLLNADMGEGMPNDATIMPYLSYANIACGGHFGTPDTILHALKLASNNKVKVGAHPSYPDPENFGRKSIQISRDQLAQSLKNQIDQFEKQCANVGINMNHIKLHGALYNDVFNNQEFTQWFVTFVAHHYPKANIFVPLSAMHFIKAKHKNNSIIEAFADRNYNSNLSLVSRSKPKAILGSVNKVIAHVTAIANKKIITINGETKSCEADTLCVHGDHPLALEIVQNIKKLVF